MKRISLVALALSFVVVFSLRAQAGQLHDAAKSGDVVKVRRLLQQGANVNGRDKDHWTPLHHAAFEGHADVARLLIEKGAQVNARDGGQGTPLHMAAHAGRTDVARILIAKGAQVNARDCLEWIPLHIAAFNGHVEVARLLIEKGSKVDAKDESQCTPLHLAARDGHADVSRLLIEKGADVNAKNGYADTPLHEAASNGHPEVVELLLEKGADIKARNANEDTPLHSAAAEPLLSNPEMSAKAEVTRLLIERGADVNATNLARRTPAMLADRGNYPEVAAMLRKAAIVPMSPEGRKAMDKGLAAAQGRDFGLAVRCFEEARKSDPYAPELLFNLGLAESRTPGRELAAMVWLKAFLAMDPASANADKVRSLYGQLEAATNGTIKRLIDLQKDVAGKFPQGEERNEAFSILSGCQARAGDVAGATQSADMAGNMRGKAYFYISAYQAANGDLKGAKKSAELADKKDDLLLHIDLIESGMGNFNSALVMPGVAEMDAEKGDMKGAMKAAQDSGDSRNIAYGKVAYVQALKGDLEGAKKTAALVSEASAKAVVMRKIEIVGALLRAENQGRLRERANVLSGFHKIIDTLNSPAFPWLTDLSAYLKSLNAVAKPLDIEWGVRKALVEETGGILTNVEKLKGLDKTEE